MEPRNGTNVSPVAPPQFRRPPRGKALRELGRVVLNKGKDYRLRPGGEWPRQGAGNTGRPGWGEGAGTGADGAARSSWWIPGRPCRRRRGPARNVGVQQGRLGMLEVSTALVRTEDGLKPMPVLEKLLPPLAREDYERLRAERVQPVKG